MALFPNTVQNWVHAGFGLVDVRDRGTERLEKARLAEECYLLISFPTNRC